MFYFQLFFCKVLQLIKRKLNNMDFKRLIIAVSVLFVLGFSFALIDGQFSKQDRNYIPRSELTLQEKGISGAMEWLNARRGDPVTGIVDPQSRYRAYQNYLAFHQQNSKSTLQTNWIGMGPDNIGGRTRALLIDRDNTNIMYAGAVSGGLWKSTTGGSSWVRVPGMEHLVIGSIAQAANGDIYIGTGEGYTVEVNDSGFWGQGIYKSTDGGTFELIPSTWDGTPSVTSAFKAIYSIAPHPTDPNKIYVGTQSGIRITTDGGSTWTNPITTVDANGRSTCIRISRDASVIVASVNDQAYVCSTGDDVFINKSGSIAGTIPTSTRRIEFDIAPSNPNYIYCQVASNTGSFKDIYQSKDKGETFYPVINSTSTTVQIFGDNDQGWYDNAIGVFPDDNEAFLSGGVDLYLWKENTIILEQVSAWWLPSINPKYIHADIHAIVYHPNYRTPSNPNGNQTIYIGCDGGIFRSIDGGESWVNLNKNYITTQFYSVAASGDGRVMGGSQDNGTMYIDFLGTTSMNCTEVSGGDGGYCEMSKLNPDVLFSTVYYGDLRRSENRGNSTTLTLGEIYDDTLLLSYNSTASGVGGGPFVSDICLWESYYDPYSNVYIDFKTPRSYVLGEEMYIQSKCKRYVRHIITQEDLDAAGGSIEKDDTIRVIDNYSSMLAVGLNGKVWMTREGIDFSKVPPKWNPIAIVPNAGYIQTMTFSADGDYIFFTNGSTVYRTSNLNAARTNAQSNATKPTTCVLQTKAIGTFPYYVTGLAVDPQNSNNLIVVTGVYDKTNYIWYSNNAATTTSTTLTDNFVEKQGNLPLFPVYSAVINWEDSREVLVGTEFGIFATSDITAASPVWTEENNGIEPVPVFSLRQQIMPNGWSYEASSPTDIYNHGYIYAGTHGRGIYRCETFAGPVGINEAVADNARTNVMVYPNPVTDYAVISCNVKKAGNVDIVVYDLNGKVVMNDTRKNVPAGEYKTTFNRDDLKAGIYLYSVSVNGEKSTGKFIVQ